MGDGKEQSNRELTQDLVDHFQLTQEEQEPLLPSGSQKVFTNRMIDYGGGVSTGRVYEVKHIDYDITTILKKREQVCPQEKGLGYYLACDHAEGVTAGR